MSVDTILLDFKVPEVLLKYFPSGTKVVGHDKEGHPLIIDPTGRVDIQGTKLFPDIRGWKQKTVTCPSHCTRNLPAEVLLVPSQKRVLL